MSTGIVPTTGHQITGILHGVELVRLGTCDVSEFEQHGDEIRKGPRGTSQVVVKPAEGWSFRFDILSNCYRPVRTLPVKRTFVIRLEANTQEDVAHIEAIKRLACAVNFEETTPAEIEPPPVETSMV